MYRFATRIGIASVCLVLIGALARPAHAQYVQVYYPTVVAPAPVVTTSYYAPVVSYYAPTVSYYAPVTSYYAAPAATGVVTTRTYYGYGIFRPRGVYTQSYYTPAVPVTTYYAPVLWR